MSNIRIEKVGNIDFEFPYLEVFSDNKLFLEIAISDKRELVFKLFPTKNEIMLNKEEWKVVLVKAKNFLAIELENYDFLAGEGQL